MESSPFGEEELACVLEFEGTGNSRNGGLFSYTETFEDGSRLTEVSCGSRGQQGEQAALPCSEDKTA